ncbi:hypothetical protein [Phocaeicola faecalis]
MRTDYYLVKDKILFALQNTQRNKSVTTDFIYSFIEELIKQGWERKDIYELVLDIQNNHHTSVSQKTIEILYELETLLSGYCAAECIYRFPNEPKDCKELQDYVLGNNWKTS